MRNDDTITIPAELNGDWTPDTLRGYAERQPLNARQVFNFLADAIDEQHPPRMDEPGLGNKVKAFTDRYSGVLARFVRCVDPTCGRAGEWVEINTGFRFRWDQLIDPKPLS